MVSAQLGLLAALFIRARIWIVIVLILGLVSMVSGSGIAIVLIGVLVMLLHHSRRLLTKYIPLSVAAVIATTFTPFGAPLLDRTTEYQTSDSSMSLRAIQPYSFLYPEWVQNLPGVLLGYGPGSAQRVVDGTNVIGLLVPSPAKVFFEYGIIAGLVLATFLLCCYWGGPSRAFSVSLLCSLWFLQPGTTTIVIVAPLLALVTRWSPRIGPPIESILPERRSADRRTSASRPASPVPGSWQ